MLDFIRTVTERKHSTGVYVVVWGELHGPYSAEIAPEVVKDYKKDGIDSYMIDELTGRRLRNDRRIYYRTVIIAHRSAIINGYNFSRRACVGRGGEEVRYIIDGKEFGLLSAVAYLVGFLPEEERCDEEEYIIEDLLCWGEDVICGKEIERRK